MAMIYKGTYLTLGLVCRKEDWTGRELFPKLIELLAQRFA